MHRGFIRLWRCTLDSEVMADDWLFRLWCWCLMSASHKDTVCHGETIPSGSFVTGRNTASQQLRVSPSKFYRGLQHLVKMENISIKTNRDRTIVTICNWKTYNSPLDKSDQQGQKNTTKVEILGSTIPNNKNSEQQEDNVNSLHNNELNTGYGTNSDSQRTASDTTSGQPADTFKNVIMEDVKNGILFPPSAEATAAKKKTPPKEKKPRARTERDDIFDAVVAITGASPATAATHIGKVVTLLLAEIPPYTPDEIRRLPSAIAAQNWPKFTLTLGAIPKHIHLVRATLGTNGAVHVETMEEKIAKQLATRAKNDAELAARAAANGTTQSPKGTRP